MTGKKIFGGTSEDEKYLVLDIDAFAAVESTEWEEDLSSAYWGMIHSKTKDRVKGIYKVEFVKGLEDE